MGFERLETHVRTWLCEARNVNAMSACISHNTSGIGPTTLLEENGRVLSLRQLRNFQTRSSVVACPYPTGRASGGRTQLRVILSWPRQVEGSAYRLPSARG